MRYLFLIILAVVLVGCSVEGATPATQTPIIIYPNNVTYLVTTTNKQAKISLTYENETGATEQRETQANNGQWTYKFKGQPGQFLYLSVQEGNGGGTVTCSVTVDGVVIQQATSNGAYVIASCSGSVPRSR